MIGERSRTPLVTVISNDVGQFGGTEIAAAALIAGLLERGHVVSVISRTCPFPPGPQLRWHRIFTPSRPAALSYPLFVLAASATLLKTRRRGVVHSIGVSVLQAVDVATFQFCHHGARRIGLRRGRRRFPLYRLNDYLVGVISRAGERWLLPDRARRVVAVSQEIATQLTTLLSVAPERITVIPNAADPAVFKPDEADRCSLREELGLIESDLVSLFVGLEWDEKGLAIAISALKFAPEWKLVVVGDGDRARFEEHAASEGVKDRVLFVGRRNDVARYYRSADAFVSPSRYEAASLALYEAAASGLPLIATDVGSARDLAVPGVSGELLPRSPEAFGASLRALTASGERREQLGAGARSIAARFSWTTVVDAYEALYRELAN